jgi:hypothetical protein
MRSSSTPRLFHALREEKRFRVQHDFESLLISALEVAERDAHVLVRRIVLHWASVR